MSEDARRPARARLSWALTFARSAEPRAPLSQRAVLTDIVIAALVLVVSLFLAKLGRWPGHLILNARTGVVTTTPGQVLSIGGLVKHELVAIVLLSVPLAARRRFPVTAFGVLLLGGSRPGSTRRISRSWPSSSPATRRWFTAASVTRRC